MLVLHFLLRVLIENPDGLVHLSLIEYIKFAMNGKRIQRGNERAWL